MWNRLLAVAVVAACVPNIVRSQIAGDLHAVRPLPGYMCMSLNLNEQQMMDPSAQVPVLSDPSPESRWVGNAAATVIVASPLREVNGYLRVLKLDGQPGWIAAKYLKPWRNPGRNGQQCVPSLMSNGRPGFGVR